MHFGQRSRVWTLRLSEPTNVKGSYTLTLTTSGSTLTGASALDHRAGHQWLGQRHRRITRRSVTTSHEIIAPAGATVVASQLIQELDNEAGTSSPLAD